MASLERMCSFKVEERAESNHQSISSTFEIQTLVEMATNKPRAQTEKSDDLERGEHQSIRIENKKLNIRRDGNVRKMERIQGKKSCIKTERKKIYKARLGLKFSWDK